MLAGEEPLRQILSQTLRLGLRRALLLGIIGSNHRVVQEQQNRLQSILADLERTLASRMILAFGCELDTPRRITAVLLLGQDNRVNPTQLTNLLQHTQTLHLSNQIV